MSLLILMKRYRKTVLDLEKKKRDTIIFLVLRVLIIIYIYINDIYNLLSIQGANYHLYDFTRRYLGEFHIEWSYI